MRLTESPRDRFREVTIGLAAHRSLPNILLGAFLTSCIQLIVGMVGWAFPAVSGALWLCSVLVYAVADEVLEAIKERRRKENDPWRLGDVDAPWGIE